MEITVTHKKGGTFILQKNNTDTFYSVEYRSEEAKMIQEVAHKFLSNEIFCRLEEIESPEGIRLTPHLLKKCGALGLLGLEVPENLGGSDLSLTNTLHFVEEISKSYSFCGAIGVQTSIGISPILLYGSTYIKEKYLPQMITGALISAFCLTEPNAGSDANSGKTRAIFNAEGNYIINGQKAWISNGGLADIYIVFAKIEDDKNLSAFVVEKTFGGTTVGAEEKKMGLSGWSTTQLFFDDVVVPKENLLGERNQGFKIALNTLNTGRIKLAVSALGISKMTANYAVNYAIARKQFGKSISDFGAIKEKLAQMYIKSFALESLVYRAANAIDTLRTNLMEQGSTYNTSKIDALKDFSIECAIAKVYGSEVQDFIVDEGLQIYGGMGYSAEAPMERLYRSSRISRIFEGTNEINRLLIVKEFLKKGLKGELNLFTPFTACINTLEKEEAQGFGSSSWSELVAIVDNLKSLTIVVAGVTAQKFLQQLEEEQEIVTHVANLLIEIYALESALLRVTKLKKDKKVDAASIHIDILHALAFEGCSKMSTTVKALMFSFDDQVDTEVIQKALDTYTTLPHRNIKKHKRAVANFFIAETRYTLG